MSRPYLSLLARQFFWLTICATLVSWAGAQGPDSLQNPPVKFRREYLPASQVSQWPLGEARYRPTKPEEFERLIQLLESSPNDAVRLVSARVYNADYSARLVDDNLIDGEAILHIEHTGPAAVLLPLEPCDLAIHSARWKTGSRSPAVIGLDSQQRFCVLVEQTGDLVLSWSLRGQRESTETWSVGLHLPRSITSRFTLELHEDYIPTPSVGVVARSRDSTLEKYRRWTWELGGETELSLKVAPAETTQRMKDSTLVRQSLVYDFSPLGIELTSAIEIESLSQPVRHLEVLLDGDLQLVAALFDNATIAWSESVLKNGTRRVAFDLPSPVLSGPRVLSLRTWTPLVRQTRWQLPSIRPLGVTWQQGRATLRVPAPLVLKHLSPLQINGQVCGRQVEASPLPPPQTGESVVLDYYMENAAVEVEVARRDQELSSWAGITLDWSPDDISGLAVIDLEVSQDKLFLLEADVPQQWTIDSVISKPFDALSDWQRQSSGGPIDRLELRFGKALAKGRPIRLVVTGRLLRPLPDPIKVRDLEMVHLRGNGRQESWLGLRATGDYRLQAYDADALVRREIKDWEPLWLERMSGSDFDLLVQPPDATSPAKVALLNQRPQYSASLTLEVAAGEGTTWQACRIQCEPLTSRPVERLLVRWPNTGGGLPVWSLGKGADSTELTAKQVQSEGGNTTSPGPSTSDLWELTLQPPRQKPFEILARRSLVTPPDSTTPARLHVPSLSEATSQESLLVVRTLGEVPVEIDAHGLHPVPVPSESGLLPGVPRAAFRHTSSSPDELAPAGYVTLFRLPTAAELPTALVWRCDLESRYEPRGATVHWATCLIENLGADELTITLPKKAEMLGAWLGQQALSARQQGDEWLVDLQVEDRFSTLTVYYQVDVAPWQHQGRFQPPWPKFSAPLLERSFQLWLPPGFAAYPIGEGAKLAGMAELSWSQRLFGPLGRRANVPPFDPVSRHAWQQLVGLDARQTAALREAESIIERFEAVASGGTGEPLTNWGELLSLAVLANTKMVVDHCAMQQAGITPKTPLPTTMEGVKIWPKSQFALWVQSSTLVLTTQTAAEAYAADLRRLSDQHIYWMLPSRLHAAVYEATLEPHPSYPTLSTWLTAPASPWPANSNNQHRTHTAPIAEAWNLYAFEPGVADNWSVWAVRRSTWEALSWSCFLCGLALGGWWVRKRMPWLPSFTCLAGAVALVVPVVFVPWTSSFLLGLLLAWLLRFFQPHLPSNQPEPLSRHSHRSTSRLASVGVLMLCATGVAMWWLNPAWGQEGEKPAAAEPVYRVLIPADDAGLPLPNELYQVPVEFYRLLRERVDRLGGGPRGWLLGPAHYRGAITRDLQQQAFVVSPISATYSLRTFGAGLRVQIPLHDGQQAAEVRQVLLDGRPVAPTWDDSQHLLNFEVAEPGVYRLEVTMQPRVESAEGASSFELFIPPSPAAHLELSLPSRSPSLDVVGSRGPVEKNDVAQLLSANIGFSPMLSVKWREDDPAGGSGLDLKVDQLIWLKVQPGSTQVDVQLRYRVGLGAVRRLYIAADSRLRPLRDWQAVGLRDWQKRDLPGNPKSFVLNFSKPVSGTFTVEASFTLEGNTGIGNLRLPRLEPLWAEVQKCWLAVSMDPNLEVVKDEGLDIASYDFLSTWGVADLKPKLFQAYDVTNSRDKWSLQTRPKVATVTVDQTTYFGVGRQTAQVRWEGVITTRDAPSFQYSLQLPTGLQVRQLAVYEDNTLENVRWSQASNGTVTVFLDTPAGRQQMVLLGELPVTTPGELQVPKIQMEKAQLQMSQTLIFRKSEVLLDLPNALPAAEQRWDTLGRLVAVLNDSANAKPPVLQVRPNRCELQGRQVTSLARQENRWMASVELSVDQVTGGVADKLEFDLPANWTGPFEISPPAVWTTIPQPAADGQRLVVRPRGVLNGPFRLTIRGPVQPATDGRLRAPQVQPVGFSQIESFVVLPTQLDLQEATWDIDGLTVAELPTGFDPPPPKTFAVYRVNSRNFLAHLESIDPRLSGSHVRLADLHISWVNDREYRGLASFDVEPSGQAKCGLDIPPTCHALSFLVAGLPADAVPLTPRTWRVNLGSSHLVQRVDVLFTGYLADPHNARLDVPSIVGLPVRKTLWTMYGQATEGTPAPWDSQTAPQQELERLISLAELLEHTSTQSADIPAAELSAWSVAWHDPLQQALRSLERSTMQQPARHLRDRLLQQQALFKKWSTHTPSSTSRLVQAAEVWRQTLDHPSVSRFYMARNPLGPTQMSASIPALRWTTPPPGMTAHMQTSFAVFLLLALAGLSNWKAVQRTAAAWVYQWPWTMLAVFGVCWWLYLEPSLLGWLALLLSTWLSIRPRRERGVDWTSTIHRHSSHIK